MGMILWLCAFLRFMVHVNDQIWPFINSLKKIEAGESIQMYGDGSTKRNYTYIDDIVAGIKGAINYTKTGYEIINLGGDEPITLKRMIGIIETAVGKPAIIEQKPMQPGV